jgi:hypothetical protein
VLGLRLGAVAGSLALRPSLPVDWIDHEERERLGLILVRIGPLACRPGQVAPGRGVGVAAGKLAVR